MRWDRGAGRAPGMGLQAEAGDAIAIPIAITKGESAIAHREFLPLKNLEFVINVTEVKRFLCSNSVDVIKE